MFLFNFEGFRHYKIKLIKVIFCVGLRRTCVNVMLAPLERYSANLHVNIPQSDPFICWGMLLTVSCWKLRKEEKKINFPQNKTNATFQIFTLMCHKETFSCPCAPSPGSPGAY